VSDATFVTGLRTTFSLDVSTGNGAFPQGYYLHVMVCDASFDASTQHNMFVKLGTHYLSVFEQCLDLNAGASFAPGDFNPFIPRFDASTHCWTYPICHASTFVEGASAFNECSSFNGGCPSAMQCKDPNFDIAGDVQCECRAGVAPDCIATQVRAESDNTDTGHIIAYALMLPVIVIVGTLCVCWCRNRKKSEATLNKMKAQVDDSLLFDGHRNDSIIFTIDGSDPENPEGSPIKMREQHREFNTQTEDSETSTNQREGEPYSTTEMSTFSTGNQKVLRV
jgi:hypothetical protein